MPLTAITDESDERLDPFRWRERRLTGVLQQRAGGPLFIAEGHNGRLPRPDAPTIAAVTKLMLAAGLSTEGERPTMVDEYAKKPEPPKSADTKK